MSRPSGPVAIEAARLVDASIDGRGWLILDGAKILDRGQGDLPADRAGRMPQTHADIVMPGLVDIHVHGARGVDFSAVGIDPAPAIEHHNAAGATTLIASLATASLADTLTRIRELRAFCETGQIGGLHLEGPWLSPARRGAHAQELLRAPDRRDLEALLDAGDGAVRMVTIAPELPGALEVIDTLVDAGVVAAIGHSDADATTTARAIDSGARVVTHLFNGMRPLHHRDPGLVGTALGRPEISVELIADGHHVDDTVIDVVLRAASDRLLLVSDAMAATGLGDGDYVLAGSDVTVAGGIARLADGSSLAGSTTPLGAVVSRLAARGVDAAVLAAAASIRPSDVLGLDAPRLRAGDPADLVVLDADGSVRAMKGGSWLAS